MKNLTILFAICICISCHKKDNGHTALNLVTNFTFDSMSAIDVHGYSAPALVLPTSSYAYVPVGKVNECINLLGNGYVDCNKNLFKNYITEFENIHSYSVSFWCKINDVSGTGDLSIFESRIKFQIIEAIDLAIGLRHDSLLITQLDYNYPDPYRYTVKAFNKQEWNNICITFAASDIQVFLNGTKIHNTYRKSGPEAFLSRIILGNYTISTGGLYMYLDELMVYNYQITETEVLNYYNSTK